MFIRTERESDFEAISSVITAAFEHHHDSNHNEQCMVTALRAADVLALSLVAEQNEKIIGHIAFSPVRISDGSDDWYGLGPVSVLPTEQRRGVGQSLIKLGLVMLQTKGAAGCVVLGEPKYYGKFDFKNYPEIILEGLPQQYFLALPFREPKPQGTVQYHPAFWSKS